MPGFDLSGQPDLPNDRAEIFHAQGAHHSHRWEDWQWHQMFSMPFPEVIRRAQATGRLRPGLAVTVRRYQNRPAKLVVETWVFVKSTSLDCATPGSKPLTQ